MRGLARRQELRRNPADPSLGITYLHPLYVVRCFTAIEDFNGRAFGQRGDHLAAGRVTQEGTQSTGVGDNCRDGRWCERLR